MRRLSVFALLLAGCARPWHVPSEVSVATIIDEQGLVGPGPVIEIQKDGPLSDGTRVSIDEARQLVSYGVPDPVENGITGALTEIWIDRTGQIAFVWDTNLRLYLSEADEKQAEVAAHYAGKVENDKGVAAPWVLTSVTGHAALGVEGEADVSSSLSFQEGGVVFEFVGPAQTLTQLRQLAEDQSRQLGAGLNRCDRRADEGKDGILTEGQR